jgi:outer membrane lipoprotein-sorting protein
MRRFLGIAIVASLALSFGLCARGHAASFTPEQTADLKRVSAALNAVQNMQAHFLQIGPDGSAEQGTVYLRKPGRVRFEYNPPNPILVVSDGTTVAVQNSALKTTDRYPLVDSPLRLLLGSNVDLTTDPHIVSVSHEPGLISITARQDSGPAQGKITIIFSDPAMELRQWEVVDAQGGHTLVSLRDVRTDVQPDAKLFVIQEQNPFEKRRD